MGLFDVFKKKDCEICGKEVGIFGYKKLEDGEICKDCVALLSPWFDDRRHSTVEQIKAQLAYREENRAALNAFRPTVAFGEYYTIRAELEQGIPTRFVVENDNYQEENADLIKFKDVTSFEIDVDEYERELKYRNSEGEEVSYKPPRYEYSYDFFAKLYVNNPYFDDIRVRLNMDTLILETVPSRQIIIRNFNKANFDPSLYPEYRQHRKMCDELEELFRAGMQGTPFGDYAPVEAAVEAAPVEAEGPKFCSSCGAAVEGGKFCQYCGTKF